MKAHDAIRNSMRFTDRVVKSYLEDLSDADLLVRPVPGADHIAWQLGHLIAAENRLVGAAFSGAMPRLPAGFAEKYTKETSQLDAAPAFHTKAEYLRLYDEQRAGTQAALDRLSEEDLDRPGPEQYRHFVPTLGDLFLMQANHPMMHVGQWTVVRRKLGRKPLF